MSGSVHSIAHSTFFGISANLLFLFLHLFGLTCFLYIVVRRVVPLLGGASDPRWDRPLARLRLVLQFWLGQWKHPRYRGAGILHLLIFAGFLILITRASALLALGISEGFTLPEFYSLISAYAATVVFAAVLTAAIRRGIFKPPRYDVPERHGKDHSGDAIFLLGLIALLMAADAVFEASEPGGYALPTLSLAWIFQHVLASASSDIGWKVHVGSYFTHEAAFFFLLCYRPFGVQFHVETSLFTIYFSKLERHVLKPVRWGVSDDRLDQLKSFGVKSFEDFTWKHMLDFYSCADCGRCSDQCPSNAAGRPLSPRFFTVKARDYSFRCYPVFGTTQNGQPLVGGIYSEDEIWSCTTCGACEEECPLLVEYIDKIVDLRRGLVDQGAVPQSLQKPLKALESRGNPYGKLEKKRGDWAKARDFQAGCAVPVLNGDGAAATLYFVDSITSYDDRMHSIGRATARILNHLGENFGILGPSERDSGHEVRRFGEEMLFIALRDHNASAIRASGVRSIVTADPHAFNALRHDYGGLPPVAHISQVIARNVRDGRLAFRPLDRPGDVYAYHDPCYLGRHNEVYDPPREVLDAIPRMHRVEMTRCRDRSFCCGGGGLNLFYEPKEEQRMGVMRVRMAAEAGANVIVTACPFCMVNLEDAIKVAGMEGTISAIDLAELADRQMVGREVAASADISN